jgi:hypothetical protein
MSDQPTLDGLTAPEMLAICSQAALREAKAQIAASPDMHGKRPLNTAETISLEIGISSGVNATFQELARRGLIVDRP